MNAQGWWREVGVALLISIGGVAIHALLAPMFGVAEAGRLLLLGTGSAYLLALMLGNGTGAGRLAFGAGWLAAAGLLLAVNPPLLFWLLAPLTAICLLRCLLRHPRPLPALLDASLCAAAVLAAIATLQHSHSLWLALWVFFLLQALHVFIPVTGAAAAGEDEQRFDAARRAAEAALQRLSEPHRTRSRHAR